MPPPPLHWQCAPPILLSLQWNAFGISIDEDIVKATAQRMIDLGLRDVG